MTSAAIQNVLNTAIRNRLLGGTALVAALGGSHIYYGQVPVADYALPYILWSYQAGNLANDTPHIESNQLVYVRAFAAQAAQAGTLDALVAELLHRTSLTVTGWNVFWLAREQEFQLPEPPDKAGITCWQAGAFYRVRLDQQ